jgi:hypothetical protein
MSEKFLIVTPKYGLCNQILTISKGIIFAIITKRNIIFNSFQMDFKNEDNICNFEDVIDTNVLKNILKEKNININIYNNNIIPDKDLIKKIYTGSNEHISKFTDFTDFVNLLFIPINHNEIYLDIENPISVSIPNEYFELCNYFNLNIKFVNKYREISNIIKEKINLKNYISVHLRLEDDSIHYLRKNLDFNTVNELYKKMYINELDTIYKLNKQIYVSTSLGMFDNFNNNFYKEIKEKYNLLDKNDIVELSDCREIFAIIDYIISIDSDQFIGSDWSSFSLLINNKHIKNNKPSKLIDIYKTLRDMY